MVDSKGNLMRKILMTVMAGALVLGAFSAPMAEAGKRKPYKRKASGTYVAPSYGQGDVAYGCAYAAENCVRFQTGPKDRYVKLTSSDATGQAVYLAASAPDSNGDGLTEDVGSGCGKTTKLAIPQPGQELIVYVPAVGPVAFDSCPGVATTGTVRAVFTNR